jgi:hypothetical protein
MLVRPRALRARVAGDEGVAVIVAMLAVMLMMALGLATVLTSMAETRIAAHFRDGAEALAAAEAAAERAVQHLQTVPDWDAVLGGAVNSGVVDGAPGGRRLPDGSNIDLVEATNLLNCGRRAGCGDADLDAQTQDRPWGRNNPRWQLYAYGPLSGMLPIGIADSPMYVVVWVADDPADVDDAPTVDGGPGAGCAAEVECVNPGKDVVALTAYAYGPHGVSRAVELTMSRGAPGREPGRPMAARVLTWRER